MTTGQWIQTIIEVLMLIAVIASLVYEPILVNWEEKHKEKVMKAWKQRRKFRGEYKNV